MKFLISLAAMLLSLSTQASELSTTGLNILSDRVQTASQSRYQIARVLEAESRVTTVRDAMSIKATGLQYVRDLSDFELLATYTVANPSETYILAVGDFIAQYVAEFTNSYWDLPFLRVLEERTTLVRQTMAVKNAGLKIANTIDTFLQILPYSVSNPSEEYKRQVSAFVAQNISRAINPDSQIQLIVQAETYTLTVSDAMAVKNAGLVAVHTKTDLLDLAVFSVSNPSESYRAAVEAFIRDNIGRYP